jgi:hypothetical protein
MLRATILALLMSMTPFAQGAIVVGPTEWSVADGGNGHFYEFINYQAITSWTFARDDAASMMLGGSAGHLVTITSAAEDAFLLTNFGSYIGDPNTGVPGIFAWIGLSDAASEGNFQWVTGEAFSYSNWAPSEPNNLGDEDYVQLWRRNFGGGPLWSWNDAGNNPQSLAYSGAIVEFDGPFSSPTPEPVSMAIWGTIGGLALFLRRRMVPIATAT